MCSCLTWDGAESLLKGMGGSLTCRRRSRAEPFEEPEPVAPVDSSPGSSSFHSEADSDHHLEVAGTSQVEDHPVVERESPCAPVEVATFRVSNTVGSLETPLGVDWADPRSDFRIYAVWVVPRAAEPRSWAGLHWGSGSVVYSAFINLNRGEFSGLRWRRFDKIQTALTGFRREALGHQVVSQPVKIYRWRWSLAN